MRVAKCSAALTLGALAPVAVSYIEAVLLQRHGASDVTHTTSRQDEEACVCQAREYRRKLHRTQASPGGRRIGEGKRYRQVAPSGPIDSSGGGGPSNRPATGDPTTLIQRVCGIERISVESAGLGLDHLTFSRADPATSLEDTTTVTTASRNAWAAKGTTG